MRCSTRDIPRSGGAVDFERLYQMHSRRVFRVCSRMLWDKSDAEDVTQEVFIQLLRKIDSFRGESAFTTWLHRLTVNAALMSLRKKSRLESPLGEGKEVGEPEAPSPEELPDPDTAAIGAIDPLDLKRAMAQLPPGFSRVFALHDVEGYAHREIARKLGITEGTSKSQLHKARLRLRELLSGTASRQPQTELGRVKRNVAPKAPAGMRNPKSLPPALTPERTLLPVPDARRARQAFYPAPTVLRPKPGNDEFQCAEVSCGKSECA
ncbi:MAG: RNA polymerase sigma factor [Terriglobia bacterium]